MSNYYHGAKASKQATSVSTPVVADSSIHLIVGTAPVHTVGGKVNEPVYASNYAEAVAAMGYSDEWDKYDICEEIYSSFKLYSNGPIITSLRTVQAIRCFWLSTGFLDYRISHNLLYVL